MDATISKSLIDWVNTVTENVASLGEMRDPRMILNVIDHMQGNEPEPNNSICEEERDWESVKLFLNASNYQQEAEGLNFDEVKRGIETEIAKIILLLLTLAITCPNSEKMIHDITELCVESQWGIRYILGRTLDEDNSPIDLHDILTKEVSISYQDGDPNTLSPVHESSAATCTTPSNASAALTVFKNRTPNVGNKSANWTPTSTPKLSTPVRRIFKPLGDEEVFYSAPASCPPQLRVLCHESPFAAVSECSPMKEFLASPAVSYKIKIRNLNQKITVLRKYLDAEHCSQEECQKLLAEKDSAICDLEQKVRQLSLASVEKERLFDEIDELHEVRRERDMLSKENSTLKHKLDKYDTYSNESKDVKKLLDAQIKDNAELEKKIKVLRNSLAQLEERNQHRGEWTESMKALQERNSVVEQELQESVVQLYKARNENAEQKAYYESALAEYKSALEDEEPVQGETMGMYVELKVEELQRKNEDLSLTVDSQKQDLTQLRDSLTEKDDSERAARAEARRLQGENAALHESFETLLGEKRKLDASHNSTLCECEKKDAAVAELRDRLRDAERDILAKEGDAVLLEEKLRAATHELESAMQENSKTAGELALAADALARAEADADRSRSEIEEYRAAHYEAVVKLEDRLEEQVEKSSILEIKLREKEDARRECLSRVKALEKLMRARDCDVDALQHKVDALHKRIELEAAEKKNTYLDLMRAERQHDTSNERRADEARQLCAKIETLKGDLAERDARCKELRELCDKLRRDNDELRRENWHHVSLSEMCDSLRSSVESLRGENSVLVISNEDLRSRNESLRSELDDSRETAKGLEIKLGDAEKSAASAKAETGELRAKEDRLNRRLDEFSRTVDGLRDTLTRAHSDVKTKKEEIATLWGERERLVAEKDCGTSAVRDELEDARSRIVDLQTRLHDSDEERQEYAARLSTLQNQMDAMRGVIREQDARAERLRFEKIDHETEVESQRKLTADAEEKLRKRRSEFADRYREKQEKCIAVERELKEWQDRAEEQTAKYDNVTGLYNEKRGQLEEANRSLRQAQGEMKSLRRLNDDLMRNSSRMSGDEKTMSSLSTEVRQLKAQLDFADRKLREAINSDRPFYRPSAINGNILSTVEEVATPRRRSLNIAQHRGFEVNLFRSQSDTVLDSPARDNKIMDDSLEEIFRTPMNYGSMASVDNLATVKRRSGRNIQHGNPGISNMGSSHGDLIMAQQRNAKAADFNMNSTTLPDGAADSSSAKNKVLSTLPNGLALHTEEEPVHDYDADFGSLSRVAELQGRNAGALPHLKSSYPVETQGQTPSRCDESVRVGRERDTVRRMTMLPQTLSRSLAAVDEISRRSANIRSLETHPNVRRRSAALNELQSYNTPVNGQLRKTQRPASCSLEDSVWNDHLPENDSQQEQQDPRRQSEMFEIPNTPRAAPARNRSRRAAVDKKSKSRGASLLKTPDARKTKKAPDEKGRTPSLMERMKKPFTKK